METLSRIILQERNATSNKFKAVLKEAVQAMVRRNEDELLSRAIPGASEYIGKRVLRKVDMLETLKAETAKE